MNDDARSHVEDCIRYVRPIDREYLGSLLCVAPGAILESFINRSIIAFCLKSQGRTGCFMDANAPRRGKYKQGPNNFPR